MGFRDSPYDAGISHCNDSVSLLRQTTKRQQKEIEELKKKVEQLETDMTVIRKILMTIW